MLLFINSSTTGKGNVIISITQGKKKKVVFVFFFFFLSHPILLISLKEDGKRLIYQFQESHVR